MGGRGSGRHWHWNVKDTTLGFRRLDVRRWARDGLLWNGNQFGWQWSQDGEIVANITVKVEQSQIRLIYRCRAQGQDWEEMNYPVRLLSQPCNFGGKRHWFACPARGCGRRVALLYGGRVFACRNCHQLVYQSTREHGFQRYQRRADRIRDRLGWEQGFDGFWGNKPKGMRWATFERLTSELDYWENRSALNMNQLIEQSVRNYLPTD